MSICHCLFISSRAHDFDIFKLLQPTIDSKSQYILEFFKEKALSDSRKVTLYDTYNTQRHGIRKNGKITATTFVAIYKRLCPCSKTGRLETTFLSVLRIRIRLEFSCWIRIRIENKDLDPYPATGITLRF